MPKAKKLPSGSWRCQVYDYTDNNKRKHYKSFTASTKKEAEFLAAQFKVKRPKEITDITLEQAMNSYIEIKEGVLSPTTLMNYTKYIKKYPTSLLQTRLKSIKAIDVDSFIKALTDDYSPKYISNLMGFMRAVMKYYGIDIGTHQVPKAKPKTYIVPTDEEVRTICAYFKENDDKMYRACLLGAYGCMRRGEVLGARAEDIKDGVLHIHNNHVIGIKNGELQRIVKKTKTEKSDRYIELPQFVLEVLPEEGRLVNLTPDDLTKRFLRTRNDLGLPQFRFHDLRHYCASLMHAKGIPDVYIMEYGGWSSDRVLKQIYRNSLPDYKKKFTELQKAIFEEVSHDISHNPLQTQ